MIGIDMEMPIDCAHCPMDCDTYGDGYCLLTGTSTNAVRFVRRSDNCPLHPLDDEVRVGDEVLNTINGWKYVVTRIHSDGDLSVLHCPSGRATGVSRSNVERTGRHFDEVETLLQKMRGEEDD